MGNREKKAYLNRYISSGREIEDLRREREKWREMGESVTGAISDMPRSRGVSSDKVGDAAANIARIDGEVAKRCAALARLRLEIGRYIDTVGDDTLRRVLYLRYVEGMKFEEVAVKMGYDYFHVLHLHGYALNELKDGD